jgi:hypothetical protein
VALNLSDASAAVDTGGGGQIRLATRRERDGERIAGVVQVGPWEGLVIERAG